MRAPKLLFVLLTALLLAACDAGMPTAAPPANATPTVLRVSLDPALEWLTPALDACAIQTGGLGILLSQPGDATPPDFTLQLGAPQAVEGYMAQLGEDQLAVVMHPDAALPAMTNEDLNGLWSGLYTSWSDFDPDFCVTCETPTPDVHLWVYPLESRLQQQIIAAFAMDRIAPQAQIAPGPAAARQAVAADPLAIAVLPSRWVDSTVKTVPMSDVEIPELLRMPILAMAASEPQGVPRDWLLCLQTVISPDGQ